MSLCEPDDEMRKMIDALNLPDADPDTNVCLLTERELASRFNKTTQALLRRGEAINPTTQEGRDLHSTRAAYQVEMRRRKMR